jgi:hypothetical protein
MYIASMCLYFQDTGLNGSDGTEDGMYTLSRESLLNMYIASMCLYFQDTGLNGTDGTETFSRRSLLNSIQFCSCSIISTTGQALEAR